MIEILAATQMWIYAARVNETELVVYKSPLVTDDDPLYAPVKVLLKGDHRIVCAEDREDENMYFGRGQLAVYRLINE